MQLNPHLAKHRCRVPRWALGWALLWAMLQAAAPATEKQFSVPAGDAATTLRQFAAQSAEPIVYMVDNVRGEKTNAVSGRFTPRAALEQMLEGTALAPSQDPATGAFAVARKAPRAKPETAAFRNAAPALAPPERALPGKPIAEDPLDAIVKLSPFSVHGELDHGYRATNTLAGTRLRSELKGIGASISVVTRDFMSDVNATDLTSLLVYTLGTEVGGYGGNFSDLSNPEAQGVFDDALGQASPGTRIRGLIHADRTRNYFLTDVPMDSYNVERVEISRGANANLFGLGSPAGIINSNLIQASLAKNATTTSVAFGSYSSHRETLDHNQVIAPGKLALRVAGVFDHTRYPTDFAFQKRRGATGTVTYQPFAHTTLRVTSEVGRSDSNRPELRPPFDRFSWWWAAGQPVWDPAAPGGGAGRLLGVPQAPFTATTVFTPEGTRLPGNNLFTANWGGSAPNEPMLIYLNPASSALGGLSIGGGRVVDGVKAFADASALNAAGTALVPGGMLGLNSRFLIEQNVYQAANPLRSLYSREPMVSDPAVFDFYHQMLGGPTKYEFGRWETHNITLEQTFLDQRVGFELSFDRQRIDNGFTSPFNYAINLDPNERLPNGAANPNFLRPVTIGGGFKRIYSQDRDAARVTGFYRFDFREVGASRGWGRWLGRHLLNANYARQDYFYQQFGGTLWNSGLDWRTFESLSLPGTASSTARMVAVMHYVGNSLQSLAGPGSARVSSLTAGQDPSGIPSMTLLANPRPTSPAPGALAAWAPATFSLVTNGRSDVDNTIRNALRYSDRLEQQVRSASAVLQSHWLDGNLVTTAGWRRDQVWSFDAGIPGMTPLGTADVRWEVFYPKLTRTLTESSGNWSAVAHLPPSLRRGLPAGMETSVFYNYASNFRVAPQRYTITSVSLPSENGRTREYGLRLSALNGKIEFRVARYQTLADHATASGLIAGLNQLAMFVPQVVDHNFLGDNTANPAGIAAFEAWLGSPNGQVYRRAFSVNLVPNAEADRPASLFGRYADATGDRGQISGVSRLESQGCEFEVTLNPTRHWRLSANAASATAVRSNIAPELYDFLFNPGTGLMRLVQNADGSPSPAGQLTGSPIGGGAATLQSFVLGNVINNGIIGTFAQEGTRTDELRKWSFRAVTNYSFGDEVFEGRLKGFGLGGAVRWSQAPLLGYAGKTVSVGGTTLAISDVTRPYYGAAEAIYDGWLSYTRPLPHGITWKLQLNVRNLGVGNKLKPLAAWPDGTVVQWTIREPQRWTVTSTFAF